MDVSKHVSSFENLIKLPEYDKINILYKGLYPSRTLYNKLCSRSNRSWKFILVFRSSKHSLIRRLWAHCGLFAEILSLASDIGMKYSLDDRESHPLGFLVRLLDTTARWMQQDHVVADSGPSPPGISWESKPRMKNARFRTWHTMQILFPLSSIFESFVLLPL